MYVDIVAPVPGVVTDQQVTNAAGVQALGTNPFTISDLSSVWVICDVYENDLAQVRIGDTAEIAPNAFFDHVFKGTVSNVGAILDPGIRTGKVRTEVQKARCGESVGLSRCRAQLSSYVSSHIAKLLLPVYLPKNSSARLSGPGAFRNERARP